MTRMQYASPSSRRSQWKLRALLVLEQIGQIGGGTYPRSQSVKVSAHTAATASLWRLTVYKVSDVDGQVILDQGKHHRSQQEHLYDESQDQLCP